MPSKKYKGRTCVYCAEAVSETADHVVCRNFFLPEYRDNLPKVPACLECNGAKSKIEHYLTALLPFGSGHPAALSGQTKQVERRLRRNRPLREQLSNEMKRLRICKSDGQKEDMLALPIDGSKWLEYLELVVRGLVWHEWGEVIPSSYVIRVVSLIKRKFELFENHILTLGEKERVAGRFAGGAFCYSGTSAPDDRAFTVWRISLYDDLLLVWPAEDGENHQLITAVMTGPPEIASQLDWFVRYGQTT